MLVGLATVICSLSAEPSLLALSSVTVPPLGPMQLLDTLVCEFEAERSLSEPRAGPLARVTRGRRSSGAATTPASNTRPVDSMSQRPLLTKRSDWVAMRAAPDLDGKEREWVRICCTDEATQAVARKYVVAELYVC